MEGQWAEFAAALESGDSDRVTDVIEDIKEMSLEKRIDLFETCFEELTDLYFAADAGYVRQSAVRVAEQLVPGIPTVMALENDERSIGATQTEIRDQTDALCGFLLESVTDDDGRVRQSAIRGLKDVCDTYDSLEDQETIEAIASELERLAAEHEGKQRKHLLEAKEKADFALKSPIGRILEGFDNEFS